MKKKMERLFHGLALFCTVSAAILFSLCAMTAYLTPSRMNVTAADGQLVTGSFPLSLQYEEQSSAYSGEILLFGSVPVKQVDVRITERPHVIVGGTPFGIRIYTEGLVVSETSCIGEEDPAAKAGIRCGDILLTADGRKLTNNEELLKAVEHSGGEPLTITALHDQKEYVTQITPVYSTEQRQYRIGLMVRDSCAGIGTMTFIDPETGSFAGLGHGICDSKSGSLMPLENGDIVQADIIGVEKSTCGTPGSLSGCFRDTKPLGTLIANSEQGVYGTLSAWEQRATLPVAFKQEVQRGKAQLLTTVDESGVHAYDILIEDISYNNVNASKNMTIRITDPQLLEKTGGIVQGMSGSPILQNGRFVGAVTHVFVNDPSGGYAIFAENMISFNKTLMQNRLNLAA